MWSLLAEIMPELTWGNTFQAARSTIQVCLRKGMQRAPSFEIPDFGGKRRTAGPAQKRDPGQRDRIWKRRSCRRKLSPVEQRGNFFVWHRSAQEKPLDFIDCGIVRDQLEFFLGFDAFHHHEQAQIGAETGDAVEQLERSAFTLETAQERTVDLDLIERQRIQITQAGISRSEIVQRNPNAYLAQFGEHRTSHLDILHLRRFRQLYFESVRGQLGFPERDSYRFDDLPVPEMQSRYVHRDTHVGRPRRAGQAGVSQHPIIHLEYQSHFFRYRHEYRRGHLSPRRMVPADEGFGAGELLLLDRWAESAVRTRFCRTRGEDRIRGCGGIVL